MFCPLCQKMGPFSVHLFTFSSPLVWLIPSLLEREIPENVWDDSKPSVGAFVGRRVMVASPETEQLAAGLLPRLQVRHQNSIVTLAKLHEI